MINTVKVSPNPGKWGHVFVPGTCLALRGDDALRFVQGQFSQDVLVSKDSQPTVYGLFLSLKGKVLADAWALRLGPGEIWLLSVYSPVAVIAGLLESHLIADEVEIEDHTTGWSGLALGGPIIGELQAAIPTGQVPPPGQFARVQGGVLFRGRREAEESWEWFGPSQQASKSHASPSRRARDQPRRWRRAGASPPAFPPCRSDLGPGDLPQEGGLETVGVSFNKGCYVGQEVMARLHGRGRIRRRLMSIARASEPAPDRLTALFQAGKKSAEVRSAIDGWRRGWLGLAMVIRAGLVPTELMSTGPTAPATIRPLDLP